MAQNALDADLFELAWTVPDAKEEEVADTETNRSGVKRFKDANRRIRDVQESSWLHFLFSGQSQAVSAGTDESEACKNDVAQGCAAAVGHTPA